MKYRDPHCSLRVCTGTIPKVMGLFEIKSVKRLGTTAIDQRGVGLDMLKSMQMSTILVYPVLTDSTEMEEKKGVQTLYLLQMFNRLFIQMDLESEK